MPDPKVTGVGAVQRRKLVDLVANFRDPIRALEGPTLSSVTYRGKHDAFIWKEMTSLFLRLRLLRVKIQVYRKNILNITNSLSLIAMIIEKQETVPGIFPPRHVMQICNSIIQW